MRITAYTLTELRDTLASYDGWLRPGTPHGRPDGSTYTLQTWTRYQSGEVVKAGYDDGGTGSKAAVFPTHPYPATLEAAANTLPPGWVWTKTARVWTAVCPSRPYMRVYARVTGCEITDRYTLAFRARNVGRRLLIERLVARAVAEVGRLPYVLTSTC
jgi:hypothetical protein